MKEDAVSRTVCLVLLSLIIPLGTPLAAWAQTSYWSSSGPYGGRILTMSISPDFANDHTVFAGTESGGLFRSTDEGDTWQGVESLPVDLTVSSVAISPDYAQDGTAFLSSTQGGIFKSSDGGETWSLWSDGLSTLSVTEMAISPAYGADQTLIAATDQGFHVSTTAGKQWLPVAPLVSAHSVAIAPTAGEDLTVFGGTIVGLYLSEDSGQTWQPTTLNGVPVICLAVSPSYGIDQIVLAGTLAGVYLSTDGGATWGGPWLEELVVHHILFSANYVVDDTTFLGTDDGVYVSTETGTGWTADGLIDDAVHALVASPAAAILYAGTDQSGVFFSGDGGATWTARNRGIANLPLEAVTVSPDYVADRTILAGGQAGAWRSTDDGLSWQPTSLTYAQVNALRCSPNFAANGTAYAATNGGVFLSEDRGRSWDPTPGSLGVVNVLDLTLSPEGDLWVSTTAGGVYYSPDSGASWEQRSTGLTTSHVTAIEWLGTEGEAIYLAAGTWGQGVFVSDDGGLLWEPAETSSQMPHVRDLASAIGYDERVWSFAATTAGVFRSGNLGQAWDFTGLVGTDIASVALHPNYAARTNCYLGSYRDGVFRSLNGGLTWAPMNAGLGNLRIREAAVAIDTAGVPVLFVATRAGLWRHGGAPQPPEPSTLVLPLVFREGSHPTPSAASSLKAPMVHDRETGRRPGPVRH